MIRWGPITRAADRAARPGVVIYAYGASPGMSLLAMNNALHDDILRRRFHAELRIKAVESLLFGRAETQFSARGGAMTVLCACTAKRPILPAETRGDRSHLHAAGVHSG
jgi:hypothetical protein